MAIPPAASTAAMEVVLTPSVLMVISTRSIVRLIETRLLMKVASVPSVWRLSKILLSIPLTRLMSQAPIVYITRAATTFNANVIPSRSSSWKNWFGSVINAFATLAMATRAESATFKVSTGVMSRGIY